jgi:hypothetical protein
MFKRRLRRQKTCPRCREKLQVRGNLHLCTRCLLIWHGDTFEPLNRENVGSAYDDYFFRT